MEKVGDIEAKGNLQPPFYVKEIDSRYPKDHCPLTKKDKEDTYQEPRDEASKDKNIAKSYNSSTSTNQPQIQASKKEKHSRWGGHGGILATEVNTTKVAKKYKEKVLKDLNQVKCYTCHQKGHYANKS